MNFTILLTKSKIGLKPCTTVLIMNFHAAFKAMIPKDIIIMTMNVMVHIWAQKLITYFKTVFVGWLLSVMPCKLLTATPPLVGPRILEVLTEVLLPTTAWLTETEVLTVAILSAQTGRNVADNHKEWCSDVEWFDSLTTRLSRLRMESQPGQTGDTRISNTKALLFYMGII